MLSDPPGKGQILGISWGGRQVSIWLRRVVPFGPVPDSISDLLGLRLSLPLSKSPGANLRWNPAQDRRN